MEIIGSPHDRRWAGEVAQWCQQSADKARKDGELDRRPFVQNVDIIIAALQEYAHGIDNEMAVRVGAMLADQDRTLDVLASIRSALCASAQFPGIIADWSKVIEALDEMLANRERDR